MMMKVSDYLVKKLVKYGVRQVFMVTGGGAMHLDDSFGKSTKIKRIFNHNEQAVAMSAEAYARTNQQLAVACVTTGPGGLNCLNGVFGAWPGKIFYHYGFLSAGTSAPAGRPGSGHCVCR